MSSLRGVLLLASDRAWAVARALRSWLIDNMSIVGITQIVFTAVVLNLGLNQVLWAQVPASVTALPDAPTSLLGLELFLGVSITPHVWELSHEPQRALFLLALVVLIFIQFITPSLALLHASLQTHPHDPKLRQEFRRLELEHRLMRDFVDGIPHQCSILRLVVNPDGSNDLQTVFVNRIGGETRPCHFVMGAKMIADLGFVREYIEQWVENVKWVLETNETVSCKFRHCPRPRDNLVIQFIAHPVFFPLKDYWAQDPSARLVGTFCEVCTDSDKEINDLLESEARLRCAVEESGSGVWDWNVKYKDFWGSPGFFRLLGFDRRPDNFNFSTLKDLMSKEDQAHCTELFEAHVRDITSLFNLEFQIQAQSKTRWLGLSGKICEVDKANRPARMVGVIRNITERKEMDLALQRALDSAQDATRAKSDFLANISHEIRTPLNGIIGMSSLLAETEFDKYQRELVEAIFASSNQLFQIVTDVLDFSKIEAGKIDLNFASVHFRDHINNILSTFQYLARKKGLTLQSMVEHNVPEFIICDHGRVSQILINLLGNSIKFTKHGSVVLRISVRPMTPPSDPEAASRARDSKFNVELLFQVQDTGIGIPADRMDRLFQSFSQVNASTSREYGGTGLGLAICRSLVALMGGAIWCESVKGQGSSFLFTIPTAEHKTTQRPVTPEPAPSLHKNDVVLRSPQLYSGKKGAKVDTKFDLASHLPWRILLAEDNPINQKVVLLTLRKMGYQNVDVVNNGIEALDATKKKPYDLILMDLQMPSMSGLEATKLIREREQLGKSCPPKSLIVALTANASESDRQSCQQAGMDGYLTKPIQLPAFYKALKRLGQVNGKPSNSCVTTTPPRSPESKSLLPPPDTPEDSTSSPAMSPLLSTCATLTSCAAEIFEPVFMGPGTSKPVTDSPSYEERGSREGLPVVVDL